MTEPVIEINKLTTKLGGTIIHRNLDMSVMPGQVIAIVGGSGCGKTTLVRVLLQLIPPTFGTVKLFGVNMAECSEQEVRNVQKRWGMLFQHNALFSSMTVLENILFPLKEFTLIKKPLITEIALLKLSLAGLPSNTANLYPSELSGGMQKRAALARAIALDPELLFLDEPTAGLDPESAASLDELLLHLRNTLGLTIVIVTHDLDTIFRVTDRVAFMGEGRVLAYQPIAELVNNPHPLIKGYFSGVRAERVASKSR